MIQRSLLTATVASFALLSGTQANAAVILAINNLAFNYSTTPVTTVQAGAGLVGVLTRNDGGAIPSAVAVATPLSLGVTWSGLDLDSVGGTNDSISFNYVVSTFTANTTPSTTRSSSQGWGVGGLNINNVNDTFSLAVANVTVSDDSGGTVSFDGFTQMNLRLNTVVTAGGPDIIFDVNGAIVTFTAADAVGTVGAGNFALDTTPSLTLNQRTSGVVRFQSSDLQFTYTPVVPEPTSLASLAVASLLMTRRRSAR